jgi:hypothetical protein
MSNTSRSEGLKIPRLLMVLSGISPLFVLWAIRGSKIVPDDYLLGFCALMVILPNCFLLMRVKAAKKQNIQRELVLGSNWGGSAGRVQAQVCFVFWS